LKRALFEAVQRKLTDQWTTRSSVRNANDHLLTGLLFDDAGHRMAPTHATKAGIRYRYYVSLPCLHREAKTAKVGSVTRVGATNIEEVVVKSLNEHLRGQCGVTSSVMGAAIWEPGPLFRGQKRKWRQPSNDVGSYCNSGDDDDIRQSNVMEFIAPSMASFARGGSRLSCLI
jgi:hypothetical protein